LVASSLPVSFDNSGRGVRDFDQLNTQRTVWFHQLNVRVDKKWFFSKWSLNLYLDIQNIYNFQGEGVPEFTVERDDQGIPLLNSNGTYNGYTFTSSTGNLIPSIGIVVKL
jgi:hypothetical protein